MKTEISTKAAIFLIAAELVEEGHCKRALHLEKDGRHFYCALGAIDAATKEFGGTKHDNQHVSVQLMNAVGGDIAEWNNHPDTTGAMVAAKLREAAFS